jgi:RNA polymerase sigma factor (sigma-70 family)
MQFVEAVENYTEYLLKLSYLYVKDRQVAEDIVQEVFVKLYQKHGDKIEIHNTQGYIVQMTVNKCKDYFRSWQYRKVQVRDLFGQPEKVAPIIADPEIIEEVLKLPLKYREVITLYYFDDYSINQVSTLLSLPVATVKTRLQRGRNLLKGILIEGGFDYGQETS